MQYGLTTVRWGGNRSSRYNWKARADNAGSDWFFLNGKADSLGRFRHRQPQGRPGELPDRAVLPWVAKGAEGWSFSVAKYGPQQKAESYVPDRGNGLRPDGTPITGNDPRETSIPSTPAFQAEGSRPSGSRPTARPGSTRSTTSRCSGTTPTATSTPSRRRMTRSSPAAATMPWRSRGPTRRGSSPARAPGAGPTSPIRPLDEGKDRYKTHADHRAHGGVPFLAWYLAADEGRVRPPRQAAARRRRRPLLSPGPGRRPGRLRRQDHLRRHAGPPPPLDPLPLGPDLQGRELDQRARHADPARPGLDRAEQPGDEARHRRIQLGRRRRPERGGRPGRRPRASSPASASTSPTSGPAWMASSGSPSPSTGTPTATTKASATAISPRPPRPGSRLGLRRPPRATGDDDRPDQQGPAGPGRGDPAPSTAVRRPPRPSCSACRTRRGRSAARRGRRRPARRS